MQSSTAARLDWPAVGLLAVLLVTAAYRLSLTNWVPDLALVINAALLGCALGLALGASRFSKRTAWLLSVGYAVVIIPWQLMLVIKQESEPLLQLTSMAGRLASALAQLIERQPVQDPLFFLALMLVTFWAVSVSSAFAFVRQRSTLAAVLPSAFSIILIQYYDSYPPGRLAAVGFFMFVLLLFVARVYLLEQYETWREQRIFTSPEASFDLTNAAIVTAAIIILAAWVLPAQISSVEAARDAWQRFTTPFDGIRERINDALASLRSSGGGGIAPQFGSTLNLGRSVSNSPDLLFTAATPNLTVARYYWRGRAYDTYADGAWRNSQEYFRAFDGRNNTELVIPNAEKRSPGRFVFTMQQDRATLVAPAEPRWFSRSAQLTYAPADKTGIDLLTATPTEVIRRGETYEVQAGVINPTIADLRAAGSDYPDWVRARYLQLPENFSPRIAALALQITAAWDAPYDKAFFITDYLRNNITYAETVETPPPATDPLEWFLFETKSGFCNYYATSAVLMLRAAGVPARLAVGYAQGDRLQTNLFAVRARHYHAWPEVYFPNIGWVEFEPTSSQPPLPRPPGDVSRNPGAGPQSSPPQPDTDLPETDLADIDKPAKFEQDPAAAAAARAQAWRQGITLGLFALAAGAAVGFYLLQLSRRQPLLVRIPLAIRSVCERNNITPPGWVNTWLNWTAMTPIERAFQSINRALRWLGNPPPPAATPAERAAALLNLLPEAAPEIRALAAEHETSLFTPNPGNPKRAWHLQWRIYWLALMRKINPPEEKPNP